MDRYFKCDKIVCERHAEEIENEEDDYMMIAFSDNGDDPEEYVILQRAYSCDEQDKELGMDSYYMEYVSPDYEIMDYGVCKEIVCNDNEIIFKFKSNADNIKSLKIDISDIDKNDIPSDFKELFHLITE